MTQENELKAISKHLFYEIDMLNIAAVFVNNANQRKLQAMTQGNVSDVSIYQAKLNCYLESFGIHARNLIEFMIGNPTKDYVRAKNFAAPDKVDEIMKEYSYLVKYVMNKSNNQVTHLTFKRIKPEFQGLNKAWDIKIVYKFNEILKHFLALVREELLCDELIIWKKEDNVHHKYISKYIGFE